MAPILGDRGSGSRVDGTLGSRPNESAASECSGGDTVPTRAPGAGAMTASGVPMASSQRIAARLSRGMARVGSTERARGGEWGRGRSLARGGEADCSVMSNT